jgi:predicted secreted protein
MTPYQQQLIDAAYTMASLAAIRATTTNVDSNFWRETNLHIAEADDKFRALVEKAINKEADMTIYKHQCGHCHRFSPLPFLIPGDILDDRTINS